MKAESAVFESSNVTVVSKGNDGTIRASNWVFSCHGEKAEYKTTYEIKHVGFDWPLLPRTEISGDKCVFSVVTAKGEVKALNSLGYEGGLREILYAQPQKTECE